MKEVDNLLKLFAAQYRSIKGISVYFAPGRVNLIGEHTDYNGGWVLPCALSMGTYLAVRLTNDKTVKLSSANFDYSYSLTFRDTKYRHPASWINYPLGIINQLVSKGMNLGGMELLFSGNIPYGAGLSSSASIEMVTATALNDMYNVGLSKIELALLAQKAENDFVGVKCGIMDQFASALGEKDSAIALNCSTLEYEIVPLKLGDFRLMITNTNKRRRLSDSKYNERRKECQKAVRYLSTVIPIRNLCELDSETLYKIYDVLPTEILKQRARHVVCENERVIQFVDELKKGNLLEIGDIIHNSHIDLSCEYEVSCKELNAISDAAYMITGVLGTRMTGAGFGGCTVSLLHKDAVNEFCNIVGRNYYKKFNKMPAFYLAEVGDGARKL